VGLSEFEVFNTASCSATRINGLAPQTAICEKLSMMSEGLVVNLPAQSSWTLQLFNLKGIKTACYNGKGSATIAIAKHLRNGGFVVARLTSKNLDITKSVTMY
jgi:hypothetical protein